MLNNWLKTTLLMAAIVALFGMVGMTLRSDSMVSMPSPAAKTSRATSKRTALPRRAPIARLGVSIAALSRPDGSSQVRCAPVILPSKSVTAAIIAGQVSVGECRSGR